MIRGRVLNKTGQCGGAEEGVVAIEDKNVGIGVEATIPTKEEDGMFVVGGGGKIRSNHYIIIVLKPSRGLEAEIARKSVVDEHINNHIGKGFEDSS
jgi:hypothetical protein